MDTSSKHDASLADQIRAALDDSVGDAGVRESLEILFRLDKDRFRDAGLAVFAGPSVPSRSRLLALVLLSNNLLLEAVTDPALTTVEIAVAVVANVIRSGSPMDSMLERTLASLLQHPLAPHGRLMVLRIMDLLAAIGATSKLLYFQAELTSHSDPIVRSKAALLIPKCSNNTAWVGRLLADSDPRVQANAIEALWSLDATPCRQLLIASSKSRHHRVAANAAVGLYRLGDVAGIPLIFELARSTESPSRAAGFWAMATTRDPRFLPFLSAQYERCSPDDRSAILRAMTCIRRSKETKPESLEIRIFDAAVAPNSKRSVSFSALAADDQSLSSLRQTEVCIWEGQSLIEEYAIATRRHAPMLLVGFVLPRLVSNADAYTVAVVEAFHRSIRYRRAGDLWRVDRYAIGEAQNGGAIAQEIAAHGYDPAIVGPTVKVRRGFLNDSQLLKKIVSSPGPKEAAAADIGAAMFRLTESLCKLSGNRHAFVFMDSESPSARLSESQLHSLTGTLDAEHISLHGITCGQFRSTEAFRQLCVATTGGTFTDVPVENLPSALEHIMFEISDGFDIDYEPPPAAGSSGEARLVISSSQGCGTAVFSLSDAQNKPM